MLRIHVRQESEREVNWKLKGRKRGRRFVVHAQDGSAATDIQDDFILEDVSIVVDGVAVGFGTDFVFLDVAEKETKSS